MFERFIVCGGGMYGCWGSGATLAEAKQNYRKAKGKIRGTTTIAWKFTSALPFAPAKRAATENEADCWVGKDGSVNWVRCEKEDCPVSWEKGDTCSRCGSVACRCSLV